jgi:hypothetical protein
MAAPAETVAPTEPTNGTEAGAAVHGDELAIDSEPGYDDPTGDEASLADSSAAAWAGQPGPELADEEDLTYSGGYPAAGLSPAPTTDYVAWTDADRATAERATGDAVVTTQPDQPPYYTAPDEPAYDTGTFDTGAPETGAPETGAPETGAPETGTYDPAGGEPIGDAAQDQAADEATLAQPEPAAPPQFLRKRSSPTPPEG